MVGGGIVFPSNPSWQALFDAPETQTHDREKSKPWQIVTTNGNASTTLRRQAELWMETEGLPDIWLTYRNTAVGRMRKKPGRKRCGS
eukprot:6470433-Amphidinium_carterae.1